MGPRGLFGTAATLTLAAALASEAGHLKGAPKLVPALQTVVGTGACSASEPTAPTTGSTDDVLAWLLPLDQKGVASPLWRCWFTKEDLKLENPSGLGNDPILKLAVGSVDLRGLADLRALQTLPLTQRVTAQKGTFAQPPFQFRRVPNRSMPPKSSRVADPHEQDEEMHVTAPVLFNPVAAKVIQAALDDHSLLTKTPSFPPGSAIVKTIWSISLAKNMAFLPLSLTSDTANTEKNIKDPAGDEATRRSLFKVDNQRLPDATQTCGLMVLSKSSANPAGCFYAYLFEKKDQTDQVKIRQALQSANAQDNRTAGCASSDCLVVLVGFHIMLMQPDSTWQFMTFWMTPSLTSSSKWAKLPGPWKFFTANKTQQARGDLTSPHQRGTRTPFDICFGPYLEAEHPSGGVSNCVRCHQMARYFDPPIPDGGTLQLAQQGGTLGMADFNGLREDSKILQQDADYMQTSHSVSAGFLWSLVNYHVGLENSGKQSSPPHTPATPHGKGR